MRLNTGGCEGESKGTKLEFDKCVICGAQTPYTKDTHIDQRLNYIEGCGQLCSECAKKVD